MQPVTRISILGVRLGIVVLAIYWLIIFVGTHLPSTVDLSPPVNDKTNHYLAFFGLGLLLCYVTNSPSSPPHLLRRFGLVALIGLCYAAFDEITQGLVPGRDPDPIDFLADAMGLIAAIVLYLVAKRLFRRSPPNPGPDRQS